MKAFDNSRYETDHQQYTDEAKKRWGGTDIYKEHEAKTADYSNEKWQTASDDLMAVFQKFAECKSAGFGADSDEAQVITRELQDYITQNYYTCNKEILRGLGQMYVCDERFRNNIDKIGIGTTEFVSKAIEIYCR